MAWLPDPPVGESVVCPGHRGFPLASGGRAEDRFGLLALPGWGANPRPGFFRSRFPGSCPRYGGPQSPRMATRQGPWPWRSFNGDVTWPS